MTARNGRIDPLGIMPPPVTGAPGPLFADDAMRERAEAATEAFDAIWIDNPHQVAVIAQLRKHIADWRRAGDGWKPSGRRLSQRSQAGKSATMKRLRRLLAEEAAARGRPPSDREVVIVLLRRRTTLKNLYRQILKSMGDPHWNQQHVNAETLLQRIEEHAPEIGMQLLVVDEAQHLDSETNDAKQIIDQLKTFVDEGRFPIVFVGDEKSEEFFERDGALAARLDEPLSLPQLAPRDADGDALEFRRFCHLFDRALARIDAIGRPSGLAEPEILGGLLAASGGHLGRVARMLEVAVPHSVWRGADRVEAYDLSHAVRSYAIKNGWTRTDPFSDRSGLAADGA